MFGGLSNDSRRQFFKETLQNSSSEIKHKALRQALGELCACAVYRSNLLAQAVLQRSLKKPEAPWR